MKTKLIDVARVIRSKNAGPYQLTLDILVRERQVNDLLRRRQLPAAETVAGLYGVPREDIVSVIWFDPAQAIKVTMKRRLPSGSPGDSDVYGAQQHAPLLDLELDLGELLEEE